MKESIPVMQAAGIAAKQGLFRLEPFKPTLNAQVANDLCICICICK